MKLAGVEELRWLFIVALWDKEASILSLSSIYNLLDVYGSWGGNGNLVGPPFDG